VNLEEYFKSRVEGYEGALKRIKDVRVFDLNAIPKRIYERRELKIIADKMAEYAVTGIPCNMIIYGSRGSGKTITMLYLAGILERNGVKALYVKARESPTSYAIYCRIASIEKTGYSMSAVRERALSRLGERSVLIIDEADFLEDFDLLYHVSRSTRASVILLSQSIQWIKRIDGATFSSLQPYQMYFSEYGAEELYQILRLRAEDGLYTWDDSALKLISALVARDHRGDARIAIRSLFKAALRGEWLDDAIRVIVSEASREVEEMGLRELKDRDLIALYAASKIKETNEAYKAFNRYLERIEGMTLSKTAFFRMLNYLQNLGFITQVRKRVGRYYTIEVDVLVNEDMIEEEVKRRFRELDAAQALKLEGHRASA